MRKEFGIHPAQASVLYALRHAVSARFSELLRTTTLTSDVFKFHMRKLMSLGYVAKLDDGTYILTARGKEYANRLDEQTGREILQPKSSMLMVVRARRNGDVVYLAHRRTREPFYDFWGIASAPVLRGLPAVESAVKELKKQSGLSLNFRVHGSYRVIDKNQQGEVLEDKVFMIMIAESNSELEPRPWVGGESVWMTKDELISMTPLFPITKHVLEMADDELPLFAEDICVYDDDQY